MLHYVPTGRDQMAGHAWLWVDLPNGDRVMFMDEKDGVALSEDTVCRLAAHVLGSTHKAS